MHRHPGLVRPREIQQAPEAFHIVMGLRELIVQRRVRDRRHVEDAIEFLVAELLLPVEGREILGGEITLVAGEILEVTGAEIVDHRQPRGGEFFLQPQDQIGTDETGATGDEQVGRRIGGSHSKNAPGRKRVRINKS